MLISSVAGLGGVLIICVICITCCCCCCCGKSKKAHSVTIGAEPINDASVGLISKTPNTDSKREELSKKYGLKSKKNRFESSDDV